MLRYNKIQKKIFKDDGKPFSVGMEDDIVWIHFSPSDKERFFEFIEKTDIHPLAKKGLGKFSDIPEINIFKTEAIISLFAIEEDYTQAKITLVIGKNYVISKEEEDIDLLAGLEQLFSDHPEKMETTGKLLYTILEKIASVDLRMIDKIADEINSLEREVFDRPFANGIARSVHRWKSVLQELRQTIEAQDQVMETLGRKDFRFVDEDTSYYFRDLINRYGRVVGALDTFKEALNSIFNLQMTLKSDHANSIMKTLTLVSVIFLPMTFLAGLYGMNFKYMPELSWKYGYPYALTLMFGTGLLIASIFWKNGWWGKTDSKGNRDSNQREK